MSKIIVHVAFDQADWQFLKDLADSKELPLSTFIRSFLLTTLRPKPKKTIAEALNMENDEPIS